MAQVENSSPALIWEVIRRQHAFKVKRAGKVWSTEPGNLIGKHSPKYSGISNNKVVDVYLKNRRVNVAIKSNKQSRVNCPAKQFSTLKVKSHPAACNLSVKNICDNYHKSSTKLALARASILNKVARRNVRKWPAQKKKAAAKKAAKAAAKAAKK